MLPVGQQLAVQLPEVLLELVQPLAMVSPAWGQLLVVAIFMHPAEGQFSSQPVTLRRIVTDEKLYHRVGSLGVVGGYG